MDDSYFCFSDSPFANNLDKRFLFLRREHLEILAQLANLIIDPAGFAVVCGEVGSGKTMLVNHFLRSLPKWVQPIIISNPLADPRAIMHEIAQALEVAISPDGYYDLNEIEKALIGANRPPKYRVLVVDDAHLLSDQSLKAIWLFSNFEKNNQKLIKFLLIGENELQRKLDRPEMQQICQGITLRCCLSPLSHTETIEYIDHRLSKVGSFFGSCFEPDCQDLIFDLTGGVPQRINQVCDGALQACVEARLKKVNHKILKTLNRAHSPGRFFAANMHGVGKPLLAVAMSAIILVIIGFLGFSRMSSNHAQPTSQKVTTSAVTPVDNQTGAAPQNFKKMDVSQTQDREFKLAERQGQSKSEPAEVASMIYRVKETDKTLTNIVAIRYPGHEKIGIEAVILANPEITNENRIYLGQVIYLPRMNFADNQMQLRDNLFYAPYGRYYSVQSLQKDLYWLITQGVHYLVKKTQGPDGSTLYRVFLGGYVTAADLHEVQKITAKKSK
jgi:type II secretory pathway predicted ATPase ExeA